MSFISTNIQIKMIRHKKIPKKINYENFWDFINVKPTIN